MRKLLFALAVIFLLQCVPAAPVDAQETRYARVTEPNTYLYEKPTESSGLFILPKTYFVKITGETSDYFSVEYLSETEGFATVRGYCRKTQVQPVDYIPENPYLIYTTTVRFQASDDRLPDGFITDYTVEAAFYGTFLYGSSVCYYVRFENRFGYVPADACPPLSYSENTEHTDPPPDNKEEPLPKQNLSAVNIVLICTLTVAALGVLYFLFRPSKKQATPLEDDREEFF